MIDAILGAIGMIIYPLFSIIFLLMDGIQAMFQAFAGTGDVNYGTGQFEGSIANTITSTNKGGETDTGLIYYLFQSALVKNLLMSIMILALFLLIIFTVMAFIKNAYSSKPKKWQEIVGNAFIGLANFIFIPVCCLLGVWLGNILLKAIDGATNIGGAVSMSRQLFLASAYNANDFRLMKNEYDDYATNYDEPYEDLLDIIGTINEEGNFEYGNGTETNKAPQIKVEKQQWQSEKEFKEAMEYYAAIVDQYYGSEGVSIYEWYSVSWGYELFNINYIVLAAGGIFLLYALCSITFGMIKRMFILLMLFIISPAMCALYPLDDGKAVGSWKGDFVKNTISAYGAVAGLNLFFSLLPVIQNISLFSSGGVGVLFETLGLTTLLLTIAGLYVVKDFISMISGYIGAGNAYADGSSLMKSVHKTSKKVTKGTSKVVGAFGKASGAASGAGEGSRLRAFGGSLADSAWTGIKGGLKAFTGINIDGKKEFKDLFKQGKMESKASKEFADLKELLRILRDPTKTPQNADTDKAIEETLTRMVELTEKYGIEKYKKDAVKASGKDEKTFDEEISRMKEQKAKERAIASAKAEEEQAQKYLKAISDATTSAKMQAAVIAFQERFGKNLQEIADHFFGGNVRQAARFMSKGQSITEDMLKDRLVGKTDSEKMAIQQAYDNFNKQSSQFVGLSESVTEAKKSLFDFVVSLNGKYRDESGNKIELTESSIAELRDTIMSANFNPSASMDYTTNPLVAKIASSGKENADHLKKIVSKLDSILPDVRKANQKDKK